MTRESDVGKQEPDHVLLFNACLGIETSAGLDSGMCSRCCSCLTTSLSLAMPCQSSWKFFLWVSIVGVLAVCFRHFFDTRAFCRKLQLVKKDEARGQCKDVLLPHPCITKCNFLQRAPQSKMLEPNCQNPCSCSIHGCNCHVQSVMSNARLAQPDATALYSVQWWYY